jgi:hypothetical protein
MEERPEERRLAPDEGGESDARDPARRQAGEDAEREGAPREGAERRATGNPAGAGETEPNS